MTCPFCGEDGVTRQETIDLLCLGGPTTECYCGACGATWFDDTDGGLEGVD